MLPNSIVLWKANPATETTAPKRVYVVITPKANKSEANTLDFLFFLESVVVPKIDTVIDSRG